jgi:hypothetical protein
MGGMKERIDEKGAKRFAEKRKYRVRMQGRTVKKVKSQRQT